MTDEWTIKVLKVIAEIMPFALSLSGSAWAYFYAMIVIDIAPLPGVTAALTACWMVSLSMIAVLSCSLKLRDVPKYLFGFLRIMMEPVLFMFVFLIALSLGGVVSVQAGLVETMALVVIILVINTMYLLIQMIMGVAMGALSRLSK